METSQTGSPESPVRLLLIEDDEDDVILLKEMLSGTDVPFEIETAGSMLKAMSRLRDGNLDLILCDLKLSDTIGLETFDALRTAKTRLPIIIMSGLADEDLAMEIVGSGAYDYVVKGRITGPVLAHKICQALGRPEK